MRLADLCSGYGGLSLALEPLGFTTVLFAENDKDASAVLARNFPGTPNVGDLKAVDWTPWIGETDAISAGYPCQPFSSAGRRKGESDERHLWPAVARAIGVLRPRYALLENVRGHLSLGFDRVLGDLADLGYVCRWEVVAASQVGACHRRERLFVVATDADRGPAQLRRGPGIMAGARRESEAEGDKREWRGNASRSRGEALADTNGGRQQIGTQLYRDAPSNLVERPYRGHSDGRAGAEGLSLLPAPTARLGDTRGSQAKRYENSERSRDLDDAVAWADKESRLLPTPTAADGNGGKRATNLEWDGNTAYRPSGAKANVSLRESIDLLSTPRTTDANGTGEHGDGGLDLKTAVRTIDWGKFAAAIARHERIFGRRAPDPLVGRRLNPVFVEWMMMLPKGWVTAPGTLPRTAQLKILGNGVVPRQARIAYESLLAASELLEIPA